jgi:hypothetical protein
LQHVAAQRQKRFLRILCDVLLTYKNADELLAAKMVFSDEATFHLSGYVNRHEFLDHLLRMSRNTEKQDRKYTYNVTLRRVLATIVTVEEQ